MARNGNVENLKQLLSTGIDPDAKCANFGSTPLMYASQSGKLECVQELLKAGASVDLENNIGYTALMFASQSGFVECVQELLKAGASVDIQNKEGYTALMFAVGENIRVEQRVKCIEELLKAGASLDFQNIHGNTALHIASVHKSIEMVKVLLNYQPNLSIINQKEKTADQITTKQAIIDLIKSYQ